MKIFQKIQQNRVLSFALIGLASAGALAYLLYKRSKGSENKRKKNQQKHPNSLCDKLGGKANIDVVVNKFYEKVLSDDRVKHFFKNTDMPHQIKQQQDFLCMTFGGPNKQEKHFIHKKIINFQKIHNYNFIQNRYTGKNMKEVHKGMDINDEQYSTIVELLAETLSEMDVSQDIINEVKGTFEPLRKDITHQ